MLPKSATEVGFVKDLQRGNTMNDTHPDVAIRFRELMMRKSGEQRLLMGCSMYDAAKQIVLNSICNRQPLITDAEIKREIFLRFYGQEFSQAERDKFFSALASDIG